MLKLIYGDVGSGKTLIETMLLYKDFLAGRNIISNYHLNFKYDELTDDMITNYEHWDYNNLTLALDELHVYMDSRLPTRKRNRIMGYFFTQSRKRSVDIYATTQFLHQVDKRFKGVCDYFIQCESFKVRPIEPNIWNDYGKMHDLFIKTTPFHCFSQQWLKPQLIYANKFFCLYDTNQIIKPPKEKEEEE